MMRGLFIALMLLVSLGQPLNARPLQEVVMPDGRMYLFARPGGRASVPLIVALHGGGGNPAQFEKVSGIAQKAVAAGFAIALPAGNAGRMGRMRTWNAGYCCANAQRENADDIGFIDRVVADAATRFGAGGPVFLTGMSNGAMMAQTYAAQAGAGVAGVVSVAGTMQASHIRVVAPVPLLHIHGTADPMVPIGGGKGETSFTQVDFAPVAAVLADFRAPFGPMGATTVASNPKSDHVSLETTSWALGGKVQVQLITVVGGGHEWPGGRRSDIADLDASDTAIAFFAAQLP